MNPNYKVWLTDYKEEHAQWVDGISVQDAAKNFVASRLDDNPFDDISVYVKKNDDIFVFLVDVHVDREPVFTTMIQCISTFKDK